MLMLASQGQVSGMPVGGAVGPRSCGLAPQPDCDLALALMHFSPEFRLSLLPSLPPQLTFTKPHCDLATQLPQGRQALSEALTQVRALATFQGKTGVALFQASGGNKPFSPVGTQSFLFCALNLPSVSRTFVCF